MFLIDTIKHKIENNFKTCFIFIGDCLVFKAGESQANKIKPVLFLVATKTLFKTTEKVNIITKRKPTQNTLYIKKKES